MSLVNGAQIDLAPLLAAIGRGISLPSIRGSNSVPGHADAEALGIDVGRHPFSGARYSDNA